MNRITLRAHAKINLNLKVLRLRPDGLHDIDSIVQTISLHDTLTLEQAPGDSLDLTVDPPEVPAGPDNLVFKAWDRISGTLSRTRQRGVRMRLEKRIPIGAGLGGGSSDCAAALAGLSRLWGIGLAQDQMQALAAGLGSDVPFFLTGGTARLRGRGTEVEPLPDLLGHSLVLVYPRRPLLTRDVYAQVQEPLTPPAETGSMPSFGPAEHAAVGDWVRVGNDLERGARRLCPVIGEVKGCLLDVGARSAAMSGSGSAVFGAFEDAAAADRAAREVGWRGWMVMRSDPLSRAEFFRDLGMA